MRRLLLLLLALPGLAALPAPAALAAAYRPREVVVDPSRGAPRLVAPRPGESVPAAAARLAARPRVEDARPNYLAHAAGFYPRDPGRGRGWARVQWNFLARAGVHALGAWRHLVAARRPGARGVRIAVLDTGVAYRNRGRYRRSPDFARTRFVAPHDFVDGDPWPLDANGHGTHVTGTIAAGTNDRVGVTGLAYHAEIMPVRVLDAAGEGDVLAIARGIDWAVRHGARVINLSLEFPVELGADQVPEVVDAVRRARARGVLVVGSAGNDLPIGHSAVSEPARDPAVLAVGATTNHRCLGRYSNSGPGIDLVAPGGGRDRAIPGDGHCRPGAAQPSIYQLTLRPCGRRVPRPCGLGAFGLWGGYAGTSMAAPHVSAAAAMVIASGVLGRRPSPAAIARRLERTADPLGPRGYDDRYGWGLVNAARATSSG